MRQPRWPAVGGITGAGRYAKPARFEFFGVTSLCAGLGLARNSRLRVYCRT